MDTNAKLTLISRLGTLLVAALLINFLFFRSLVVTLIVLAFSLILILLGFYFVFTRKEKGPVPGAKEIAQVSERAIVHAYSATLCIVVVMILLEFFGITQMPAYYALGLVAMLSALSYSLIKEYLLAKVNFK